MGSLIQEAQIQKMQLLQERTDKTFDTLLLKLFIKVAI